MNRKVSVVIPCWNGRKALDKSLPQSLKMKGVSEWILVDDASIDGSADWVEKNFPAVKVIRKTKNEGFPVTANTGVAAARSELVAIVNHDLIPVDDAVTKTLGHFQDPLVFGVTFRETGEKGWGIAAWRDGWLEISAGDGRAKAPHESFWGSGGETIYRKVMWNQLGGYDEIFSPGYWEDVDIGYRARKREWKLIWEPSAVLKSSARGESFGERWGDRTLLQIRERNRLLLIWKNVISRRLLGEHLFALGKRVLAHPGYLRAVLMSLQKLETVIKRREIERKEAKLTDEEVFRRFGAA